MRDPNQVPVALYPPIIMLLINDDKFEDDLQIELGHRRWISVWFDPILHSTVASVVLCVVQLHNWVVLMISLAPA